jgi:hypothetical protein
MTEGFIIGLRKTGTTWLYENFKIQPEINISELVKESGFLLNNRLSIAKYNSLFKNSSTNQTRIEVETRAFESDFTIERISKYNKNAKVVLILRDPSSYFISRIVHGLRKGEINSKKPYNYVEILKNNEFLLKEYDVNKIITFNKKIKYFKIFYYEDLLIDSIKFYTEILQFITGDKNKIFYPKINERVNRARLSKKTLITSFYSKIAQIFRLYGLHSIVNKYRKSKMRSALENKITISREEILLMKNYLKKQKFKFPKKYN